jgi:hypothetical protein
VNGDELGERETFWLEVAGVVATIGGVLLGVAATQPAAQNAEIWTRPPFLIGCLLESGAVGALWWAITLHVAHGHANKHAGREGDPPHSRALSTEARARRIAAPRIDARPSGPSIPTITAVEGGSAKTPPRAFVSLDIGYLRSLFKEHTGIQAAKLVEPYLNKWVRLSGRVASVGEFKSIAQLTLESQDWIYFYFSDEKWKEPLAMLRLHDEIAIVGRIDAMKSGWMDVYDCELSNPSSDNAASATAPSA